MLKTGTNFQDRNRIDEYVLAGVTDASVISQRLAIEPAVIEEYIKHAHPVDEDVDGPEGLEDESEEYESDEDENPDD